MSEDIKLLADRIGQLADAIDELVGSNTQMIDLMARQIQRDLDEQESEVGDGPRYLEDPARPRDE